MSGKREKPEDMVLTLRQVALLQGQGQSVQEAVRQIGVTVQTYCRWRKAYGGMNRDPLKPLKELETEDQRLRRPVPDLTLGKMILTEAARGNEGPHLDRGHRAKTVFIEPGTPWKNGYCESFNARFRDELLNGALFCTLREAQILIEKWRSHGNTVRPQSTVAYRPPAPENNVPMDPRPSMHKHSNRTT